MHKDDEGPQYSLNPLPGDDWEVRFTKSVIQNIARYKDERGMTTAELADACNAIYGEPGRVKASTLSGLFAGKRRSIGVAELLIFAQALNVPPLVLLFASDNREVELSPTGPISTRSNRAYDWFRGFRPIPKASPNEFWDAGKPMVDLDAAGMKAGSVHRMNVELVSLRAAEEITGGRISRHTDDELIQAFSDLAKLRRRLADDGIHPPLVYSYMRFVDEQPLELPAVPISVGLPQSAYERIEARTAELVALAEAKNRGAPQSEEELFTMRDDEDEHGAPQNSD